MNSLATQPHFDPEDSFPDGCSYTLCLDTPPYEATEEREPSPPRDTALSTHEVEMGYMEVDDIPSIAPVKQESPTHTEQTESQKNDTTSGVVSTTESNSTAPRSPATITWKDFSCALDAVILISIAAQLAQLLVVNRIKGDAQMEFQLLWLGLEYWLGKGLWVDWLTSELTETRNIIRKNLAMRDIPINISSTSSAHDLVEIFFPGEMTNFSVDRIFSCSHCGSTRTQKKTHNMLRVLASWQKDSSIAAVLDRAVTLLSVTD